MTPYLAFWLPEQLGGSGVLATVAAGLYVSWNGPLLIPSATRLQGVFFWDLVIYLLEGFMFLLTGLQARTLFDRVERFSADRARCGVRSSPSAILIVARASSGSFRPPTCRAGSARRLRVAIPPDLAMGLPDRFHRRARRRLARGSARDSADHERRALPVSRPDLLHHLRRHLVTLVGQGLLLPGVVRWLGLAQTRADEHLQEHAAELAARWDALKLAQDRLEALARDTAVPDQVMATLRAHQDYRVARLPKTIDDGVENAHMTSKLRLDLIAEERDHIYRQLQDGKITDEFLPAA